MGIFDSLTDLAAEVVASPLTLTAKAIDVTIKTAEANSRGCRKSSRKSGRCLLIKLVTNEYLLSSTMMLLSVQKCTTTSTWSK